MTLRIAAEWCEAPHVAGADTTVLPTDESTLGDVVIAVEDEILTSAVDSVTGEERRGATLSAYGLAEWLAWNWWRLRWEPGHVGCIDWKRAHDVACIGGGWLWPNVTIHTDGVRMLFDAKPSKQSATEYLFYTIDHTYSISASAFENEVDRFVGDVLGRLDERALRSTDLHTMWRELTTERADPESRFYRKIEACLGFDPDEADNATVSRFLEGSASLGESAVTEIAAAGRTLPDARTLTEEAARTGFETRPEDGVQGIGGPQRGDRGNTPAWQVGVDAACHLRDREALGSDPLPDRRLADLYGASESALSRSGGNTGIAYALDGGGKSRTVFRSKWKTGRRFEMARLLGDRLLDGIDEPFRPATRASTWRQKMQRAFASELLCPIDSLVGAMKNDYSDDAKEEAADLFQVSPLVVAWRLADKGLVGRDDMRARAF